MTVRAGRYEDGGRDNFTEGFGNQDLGQQVALFIANADAPKREFPACPKAFRCYVPNALTGLCLCRFKVWEFRPLRIGNQIPEIVQVKIERLHRQMLHQNPK